MQAWYVYNKIPRIITTHTALSQDVYYQASLLDDDWFYLSNLKINDYYTRDKDMNTFKIGDDNRLIEFNNGHYKLTFNGFTVKEFGEDKTLKMKFTVKRPLRFMPFELPYISCMIHKVNLVFWKLVPKKRNYTYRIINTYDISTKNKVRFLASGKWLYSQFGLNTMKKYKKNYTLKKTFVY